MGGWRLAVLVFCLVAGSMIRPAPSWSGAEFAYFVDRVELDGNGFGPLDDVPDYVDEFDDGEMAPDWGITVGTVFEQDGLLHVVSPGERFPSPDGIPLDISIAYWRQDLSDGGGSFRATAVWEQADLPPGHHFHFSIITYGGPRFDEVFGIGIQNLATGFGMEQHRTEVDQRSGVYRDTSSVVHPLEPSDVTGKIVMRIDFDDATNLATTSFSVDGGTTWTSPFEPEEIFVTRPFGKFVLSADPQVLDGGSTTTTTTLPPAAEVPVSGVKLVIAPQRNGTQRHRVVSKDPALQATPCAVDGELTIEVAGGERVTKALPASFWRLLGYHGARTGCIYDDRGTTIYGPPSRILLQSGKRLVLDVSGVPGTLVPLDGDPGPIVYSVRHGDVRYCVSFGDDGTRRRGRRLRGRRTSAGSCSLD